MNLTITYTDVSDDELGAILAAMPKLVGAQIRLHQPEVDFNVEVASLEPLLFTAVWEVTLFDGTTVEMAKAHYPKHARYDPKWTKDDIPLFGHAAGWYTDHTTVEAQEAAYDWRVSGASTTEAYTALKMQSGAALWNAADKWAKDNGLLAPVEARKALAGASRKVG